LKTWLIRLLACIGCGCLWFLGCADFDIWPLAYMAMLPCLLAIRGVRPRRAFWWGLLAGTVASGGGFYWITHLLIRFGHLPWAVAFGLFVLMVAYQGLHFGVMAAVLRWVRDRAPGIPMTLLLPVTMVPLEMAMPFIFPWYLSITQAWVVPVIQVADLAGPLGVTFLLLVSNGMIYDVVIARLKGKPLPWRPVAAGCAIFALALIYGGIRMAQYGARWEAGPKVKIGMVQANVGITEKHVPGLREKHLEMHHVASKELQRQGAELLVWPESSYPYYFWRDMKRDWPAGTRQQVMKDLSVPLVFGVLTVGRDRKKDPHPYNTAYYMEPDGRITGQFDKNFLLIFGEYIPFLEYLPKFRKWIPASSHFQRGTEVTTFNFKDYRLGPMICYEDIIPSFGRRLAKLKPHLLVNITNDAWFGATSEPAEHMALSVYRAVELRTGLLRSVNTGISTFIDATGKVLSKTKAVDPVETPGVPPATLLGEMTMLEGGGTVYAVVGDLFGYLNLAVLVVLMVRIRKRPSVSDPSASSEPEPGKPESEPESKQPSKPAQKQRPRRKKKRKR